MVIAKDSSRDFAGGRNERRLDVADSDTGAEKQAANLALCRVEGAQADLDATPVLDL